MKNKQEEPSPRPARAGVHLADPHCGDAVQGKVDGQIWHANSYLVWVIALVAGGCLVAFILAIAAVAIRIAVTSGPDAQSSSGMHAFGDAIVFVGVFGVAALASMGVGLYFLQSRRRRDRVR